MDPITTTIIAAGLPVVTELLKGFGGALSRKFVGLSVDDQIKLQNADVERLKALAALDTPGGTPTQWVIDLRAAFRYVAAMVLIALGGGIVLAGTSSGDQSLVEIGVQVAGFPFGFIFGERLVLALRPNSVK